MANRRDSKDMCMGTMWKWHCAEHLSMYGLKIEAGGKVKFLLPATARWAFGPLSFWIPLNNVVWRAGVRLSVLLLAFFWINTPVVADEPERFH